MKRIILAYLISISILNATGAWMMSQRTHGELKWSTISTNHFDIHYHQGIRDIALKGASIAEQIRPTLIEQMGLDTLPTFLRELEGYRKQLVKPYLTDVNVSEKLLEEAYERLQYEVADQPLAEIG